MGAGGCLGASCWGVVGLGKNRFRTGLMGACFLIRESVPFFKVIDRKSTCSDRVEIPDLFRSCSDLFPSCSDHLAIRSDHMNAFISHALVCDLVRSAAQ